MTYQVEPAGVPAVAPAAVADVRYFEWGPVVAGAVAASAIAFVLLTFGAAIGLTMTSPWPNSGVSSIVVGVVIAIWTALVQMGAYAGGGYLAGRMRVRWAGAGSDEARFRDGAHGFLVWALGVVISAAVLTSAAGSGLRIVADSASRIAGGGAANQALGNAALGATSPFSRYDSAIDLLMRPASASAPAAAPAAGAAAATPAPAAPATAQPNAPRRDDAAFRAETGRIFTDIFRTRELTAADRDYLAGEVSSRYNIPQAEARKRVEAAVTNAREAEVRAREAADKARRGGVIAAFLAAATLLISAFAAIGGAMMGGRDRDENAPAMFAGRRIW